MPTRTEINKYVQGLDSEQLRKVYEILKLCYIEDTLSDEFQIWAELMKVFSKYAEPLEKRMES